MGLQSILLKIKNYTTVSRLINLFNASLLLFLIWLTGLAAARVVESEALRVPSRTVKFEPKASGKTDKTLYFDSFKAIIDQNVFNAEVSAPIPDKPDDPAVTEQVKNQLNDVLKDLRLTGVLHGGKAGGFCIIRNKRTNKEDIFSVNDMIFDTQLVVTKITADLNDPEVHLALDEKIGILKYEQENLKNLMSPQPKAPDKPLMSKYTSNGRDFRVPRGEVEAHMQNFSRLLTQARMSPYFRNGRAVGYQFKHIKPGSVFEKLGMRKKDIIRKVNGEDLKGAKLMELYRLLRHEKEFTLEVEREGRPQIMQYNIY